MKKTYLIYSGIITAFLSIFQLDAAGNFTIKIVNNTNDPKIKMYVLVKGLNPTTKKQTFIKFDKGSAAIGTYADVTSPDANVHNPTKSLEYGYDYTSFKDSNGEYTMHLPYLESGRVYISLDNKLKMPVVGTSPNLGIADPSAFNTSDPNYNYLYDKVEFTYLQNGSQTVINPTAVDCLALPITVTQKKMIDGKEETVMYGIEDSREKTFQHIEEILKKEGNSSEWARLVIRNGNTILRIVAPGRDDAFFNKNYLNDYIDALWEYYKKPENSLTIDCKELTNIIPGLQSYIFTGHINNENVFEFKNQTNTSTVNIKKPESKHFFLADQGPFQAPNNTVQAVIVRNICSAWSIGLLPVPEAMLSTGRSNMLTREYYMHQKDAQNFYKDNSIIPTTGSYKPWYNLYAKAIHSVSKDIYAWAYDDAIGLDGTNFSTDKYPATLTLGPLTEAAKNAPVKTVASAPEYGPVGSKLSMRTYKGAAPLRAIVS
jgi:hypothetical protein